MIRNGLLIVVLAGCLGLAPLAGYGEEGLFDTQAANAHLEKGLAQIRAKNYTAAVRELEEAAEIAPEAETFYYLGYAYYLKGRSGDEESRALARENFEKAYEIDPNFSPLRYKAADMPAAKQPAPAAEQPAPNQPKP
jgi:Tfp pilus assembly protein PilF